RITSPIEGKTGALNVHVGDQIKANDTNPMVTIRQIAPIYVAFSLSGTDLPAVREAMDGGSLDVIASPRGGETQVHQGELTFVDNQVDPATGTILLKATYENAEQVLWPGEFVDVTLVLGTKEAITVPSAAVQT